MGFGAAAFGKRFRLYTIVSIVVLIGFGVLTGLDSANMEANLPTPWMGVWERICMFAYMLWVIVFAAILFRSEKLRQRRTD
jgi:thiosulfate reductase cytochrome b subunit